MRERFEHALTVFPAQSCICCGRAKIGRRPRSVAEPAPISSTQYAKLTMAQLMLSVAVEARRTLIGSTTTLAPTWTRL